MWQNGINVSDWPQCAQQKLLPIFKEVIDDEALLDHPVYGLELNVTLFPTDSQWYFIQSSFLSNEGHAYHNVLDVLLYHFLQDFISHPI